LGEDKGIDARITIYFNDADKTAYVSNIENIENDRVHPLKKGLGLKGFLKANQLIVSRGYTPVVDNLVSGYGYDMLSKLEKSGYLTKVLDKKAVSSQYDNVKYEKPPFIFTNKIYKSELANQRKQQAIELYIEKQKAEHELIDKAAKNAVVENKSIDNSTEYQKALQNYTPFIKATERQIEDLKNLDGKSINEVLNFISLNSKDPVNKFLASHFLKIIDKINFIKISSVFNESFKGNFYNSEEGVLSINPYLSTVDTKIIQRDGFEKMLGTILHEVTHAYTVHALKNPKTNEEKDFKKYITEQYNSYKKSSVFKESYGFKNEREFVSEILTNSDFRAELQYVKKNSFINNIIDAILKLLNISKVTKKDSINNIINTILNFTEISIPRKFRGGVFNAEVNYKLKIIDGLEKLSLERQTIKLNSKQQPNIETNIRKALNGKGVTNQQVDLLFNYMRSNNLQEAKVEDVIQGLKDTYQFAVEIETVKRDTSYDQKKVLLSSLTKEQILEVKNTLLGIEPFGLFQGQEIQLENIDKYLTNGVDGEIYISDRSRVNSNKYKNLSAKDNNNEVKYKEEDGWEYQELSINTPQIENSIGSSHAPFNQYGGNYIGHVRVWMNKNTGELDVQEIQADGLQKARKQSFHAVNFNEDELIKKLQATGDLKIDCA